MIDLSSYRINQVLSYYNKHLAELERKVDGLARKMGVDPDVDLVLVPISQIQHRRVPRWIQYKLDGPLKLVKGVKQK